MPTILCRVVWASEYKSTSEKFFAGNMKYPAKHKRAVETLNFYEEGGYLYGFVENNRSRINIDELGAKSSAKSLDGVSVIWCALDEATRRLRVVGWYENATVFRTEQYLPDNSFRGDLPFQIKARAADCQLLAPSERELRVPMKPSRTSKGFIGQRNWFFPDGNANYTRFLEAFLELKSGKAADTEEEPDLDTFQEGQRAKAEITLAVRNPKLVRAAKQKYGCDCQVCGFNFSERYGAIGDDFIEAHHLTPMQTRKGRYQTSVSDMRVLCANCHRMIHRRSPPLSLDELKKLLR